MYSFPAATKNPRLLGLYFILLFILVCGALARGQQASLPATHTTGLVSVSSAGISTANGRSDTFVVSANGRYVAFVSEATNLTTLTDSNNMPDIYVRDRQSGTTTLASVNSAGTGAGNGDSREPAISADGRFVAFQSAASNLVPGDTNGWTDVFVRDLQTNTTRLVSVNSSGTGSGNGISSIISITPNGRYVLFLSGASDLITAGDTNNTGDVYVRDLQTNTTRLVSVNSAGTGSGNSNSERPVITPDGRYVAFASKATDLVSTSDTNTAFDLFVRDLETGTTVLVSSNSTGNATANGASVGDNSTVHQLAISDDGRYVFFKSQATDLTTMPDLNGTQTDIFARDMQTGMTTIVSVNKTGTGSGNGASEYVVISSDGRYAAFYSMAGDLADLDRNPGLDVFVRDLQNNTTSLVSVNRLGTGSGNEHSFVPSISSDGRYVVFQSGANDLVSLSDTNASDDVFIRDMQTQTTSLVSINNTGTAAGNSGPSSKPLVTPDARYVAYYSGATDLVPQVSDMNFTSDVFIYSTDPQPGSLQFSAPTYSVDESGSAITVTVTRVGGADGLVTVNYATSNGTATAGQDYTATSGTLTFTDGSPSQTLTIPITDDINDEPDETVNLTLSDPTGGATLGTPSSATLTILDNDPQPVLTINNGVSVPEGNTGTSNATFTVSLSAASGFPVTVNYRTMNSSATSPSDYLAVNSSLTFAPGETQKPINITINGDTDIEGDETFFVLLSNPVNATLGTLNGNVGTILNDDVGGSVQFSASAYSVNEGDGTATITVTRTGSSASGAIASYRTMDGTATAGQDYVPAQGSLIFGANEMSKSFTFVIREDALNEAPETVNLQLEGGFATTLGSPSTAVLTIIDNDPQQPAISIGDVTLSEGNSGTRVANFTVTLSAASGQQVTVAYSTSDGTANAGSDYQATQGTLTFAPEVISQTISVTVNGDIGFEPNENFFVNLSNPVNASINDGQAVGTIVNDDINPLALNKLISVNSAGTASANNASDVMAGISADGRYVLFTSVASDLVPNDLNGGLRDVFLRDTLTNTTALVSARYDGTGSGDQPSFSPTMTPDGRYVAFASAATNLVPTNPGLGTDIFVRDMQTGVTTLVSVNSAGTGGSNGGSNYPSISADGRFVAYQSTASNLGPNDTNTLQDIYVRDLQAHITRLVSINIAGTNAGNHDSGWMVGYQVNPLAISADGRYVVFQSMATNLTSTPDNNFNMDVFVRNLQTDVTQVVSLNQAGTSTGNGGSLTPCITPDGRRVVFMSTANDLIANDTNSSQDIFVRDLTTNTNILVSVNSAGVIGNGASRGSYGPTIISANGRYVAFESDATNLAANDTNSTADIFVRDLQGGVTRMASPNSAGTNGGNNASTVPSISADGRFVGFTSYATDLTTASDTNSVRDAFMRDVVTGKTILLSVSGANPLTANNESGFPFINANGRYAAYISYASNMAVTPDSNSGPDVFLYNNHAKDTTVSDFDGDGRSDLGVFRPSNGNWYILQSSNSSFRAEQFGLGTDRIAPSDFDGDKRADLAVFRPSSGYWYILNSSDGSFRPVQFGQAEDIPTPADFDGDGKTDVCLYRPSNNHFYLLYSSDGSFHFQPWGAGGDVPVIGDYDGDGKSDFGIFRPSSSTFYVLRSSDGMFIGQQFGQNGDKPIAADFDGDGKTDIAVYRPSTGGWYRLNSSDNSFRGVAWGTSGDIPAAGDYDGDGKSDVAVFRPSTGSFYILQSTTNALRADQFGASGDVPVPSAYVP